MNLDIGITETSTPKEKNTSPTSLSQTQAGSKILEINGNDPNNIFIVKTVIENVPKECPKSVGFLGCYIKETCQRDSDCKTSERCCLNNCSRICIRI